MATTTTGNSGFILRVKYMNRILDKMAIIRFPTARPFTSMLSLQRSGLVLNVWGEPCRFALGLYGAALQIVNYGFMAGVMMTRRFVFLGLGLNTESAIKEAKNKLKRGSSSSGSNSRA